MTQEKRRCVLLKKSISGRKHPFKQITLEEGKHLTEDALNQFGYDYSEQKERISLFQLIDSTNYLTYFDLKKISDEEQTKKQQEKEEKQFENSFSTINCAETFIDQCPLFYDRAKLWWVWNAINFCWEEVDETDLLNKYLKKTGDVEITLSKRRSEILHSLQLVGREREPKPAKTKYIQFKDKVVDITDSQIYPVDKRFFFTNPIPWEIGETSTTPVMDKLFIEWVGEENYQTLYEIIAYCCLRDYPIQMLFCFVGGGRNGKSQFQKVLQNFLGSSNICSTELDLLLGNRFESFKLYKKLACSLGETNFGILNNTSLLKKLTGGDLIGFEKKNKDPFDDYNYSKILINSNSLPTSQDTSEGFYRRWMIIDFPNEFPEGKDIVSTIPPLEYNNLAKKVMEILPGLLEKGKFTNQGTIKQRVEKYQEVSNPLPLFLKECCDIEHGTHALLNDVFNHYKLYLGQKKRRIVSRKEFKDALAMEGFWDTRTTIDGESGYWIHGLTLKSHILNVKNVKNVVILN